MKKDLFQHNQNDDLVAVFIAFSKAMNGWEKWCSSEYTRVKRENGDLLEFQSRALQSQEKVFLQFCTKKERKYGRLGSFRVPPEYDPELEKILDVMTVSPSRAIILTQQTSGFNLQCKYVLLRKHSKWLIDNKHWKNYDGKWVRGIL
jgi:hypothetical protein